MRKKILYLLSAAILIVFTIALVGIITGFLRETTFEDQDYLIKENESVDVYGANVRVTEIIYAPCPTDVQCVWSGLAATFVVQNEGSSEEKQLVEGSNETINGIRIELLEVMPEQVRVRMNEM